MPKLNNFRTKDRETMTERQVCEIFNRWLDRNHFQRDIYPIRDSPLKEESPKERMQNACCPYRPDFLVTKEKNQKRKIAIEMKGSKFRLPELLGQLLLYQTYYSEAWAVLPLHKAKLLLKIRKLIQGKVSFYFDIFGVKDDTIYFYDPTLQRFKILLEEDNA